MWLEVNGRVLNFVLLNFEPNGLNFVLDVTPVSGCEPFCGRTFDSPRLPNRDDLFDPTFDWRGCFPKFPESFEEPIPILRRIDGAVLVPGVYRPNPLLLELVLLVVGDFRNLLIVPEEMLRDLFDEI
jgi:hypothetical protein